MPVSIQQLQMNLDLYSVHVMDMNQILVRGILEHLLYLK